MPIQIQQQSSRISDITPLKISDHQIPPIYLPGAAAVARFYETRNAKEEEIGRENRTRSRSRSRARSAGAYEDPGLDPELGMVIYGTEFTSQYGSQPRGGRPDRFKRQRSSMLQLLEGSSEDEEFFSKWEAWEQYQRQRSIRIPEPPLLPTPSYYDKGFQERAKQALLAQRQAGLEDEMKAWRARGKEKE
jgi:hypothetical protein